MLYTNIDPENTADMTIKNYLTVLGRELSDLIDVKGTRIIKGKFREQQEDNYMHGIYLAPYQKNQNILIHVQAHTILSFNPKNPEISVYIRETLCINDQNTPQKNSRPIKILLDKNTYSESPLWVAVLIASKYDTFCNS